MKEITPSHLRCGVGLCPALFKLDDGNIAIIGKRPLPQKPLPNEVTTKIGENETAIIIPQEYLKGLDI